MTPKKFLVLFFFCTTVAIGMAIIAKKLFLTPPPPQTPIQQPEKPINPLGPPPTQKVPPGELKAVADTEAPHPTGVIRHKGRITVVMSDGTTRTDEDNIPATYNVPESGKRVLEYVARNFIILNGKREYIKPSPPRSGENFATNTPVKNMSNMPEK